MTPHDRSAQAPIARWVLELLGFSALAVAQPLFDLVSRQPAFLVAHQSGPREIAGVVLALYLGVPLVLLAAPALLWRPAPTAAAAVQSLEITVLVALLVAAPLNRLEVAAPLTLGAAGAAGGAVALALRTLPGARLFTACLAALTVVLPLRFLLASPVADLVTPTRVDAHRVAIGRPAPVVVLILDELPLVSLLDASHGIDATMFPHFAALASRSHWFRNATAVAPLTDLAVPAILTGRRPRDVAPTAAEHPDSLFTLLGASYEMRVVEPQTQICPPTLCGSAGRGAAAPAGGTAALLEDLMVVYLHVVAPPGIASRLPSVATSWGGFLDGPTRTDGDIKMHIWAADRKLDVERFLGSLEADGAPRVYFLHAMLPHLPWVYLPSGREYWGALHSSAHAPGVAVDTTWTAEQWLVDQAYQRHLAQVAYVDALLGRLQSRLAESGLDERALLVVTSDHGFSFRSGEPGRHPTRANHADIMAVPLFVRLPGQQSGTVSDRNVETIDILPTIADALEVELPFATDGESAFSTAPERPGKEITVGSGASLRFSPYDEAGKYESARRKLDLFARGLFGIGPHPELLGRTVESLAAGHPVSVVARLDQVDHYLDVDPAGPFLPAQIFGRLRRDSRRELVLAVAVNGVVRGITRPFDERGGERFVTLVPEESFRRGANAIDLFVVGAAAGRPVLHPLERRDAPAYRLELAGDGAVRRLVGSDGSDCQLDAAAVEGGFERRGTAVLGWAHDPTARRPYVVIMAFAGARLIYSGATGVAPPPAAGLASRPEYAVSGFQFVLPAALVDGRQPVRVFGVLGERGAELPAELAGNDSPH